MLNTLVQCVSSESVHIDFWTERTNIQYEFRVIKLSVQWANLMFPFLWREIQTTPQVRVSSYLLKQKCIHSYEMKNRLCVCVMSQDMCDGWTWTSSIIMPSAVICVIQTGIQLTGNSAQLPPASSDTEWPSVLKKYGLESSKAHLWVRWVKVRLKIVITFLFLNEKIQINNWTLSEVHWQLNVPQVIENSGRNM